METHALVLSAPNAPFSLTPTTLSPLQPDEVLVEIHYAGICHSDLLVKAGFNPAITFPCILGHEGAGIIKALGTDISDPTLKVGTSVVLSFDYCGTCKRCETNHPALCQNFTDCNVSHTRSPPAASITSTGEPIRSRFFGQSSFSRLALVKHRCVIPCPDVEPHHLSIYAGLGCGFQTGAGTVLNVLKPAPADSIVIFGMGSVGLAALMAAKDLQLKKIIAIDILPSKLALAKELGATEVIDSSSLTTPDLKFALQHSLTAGEGSSTGADYAIDTTGSPDIISTAITCLAPGGTCASVGIPTSTSLTIDPLDLILNNKRYIGVMEGDAVPREFIPKLMSMHRDGKFPIEKLVKVFDVGDKGVGMQDALEGLKGGGVVKPVLKW